MSERNCAFCGVFVCLLFLVCLSRAATFCLGLANFEAYFYLFVLSLTIVVAFVGFLFEFEFCRFCSFYFILSVLYSLLVSTVCVLLTRLPFLFVVMSKSFVGADP